MAKRKNETVDLAEPEVIPPPPPEVVAAMAAEQVPMDKPEPAVRVEAMDTSKTSDAIDVTPVKEKEKQEVAPQAPKSHIALDGRGVASPTDVDGAFRMAKALFIGKGFPNWVRSPEQAFAVYMFLKALGLDVMTGIQHVCEVNGRLSLWGEGPLAAVRASGKMSKFREYYIDKDYKEISVANKNLDQEIFAAIVESTRVDTGEVKQSWFSQIDEKTANKGLDAVWRGYKRIMYKRKARAEHVKDLYGDIILGAGIAEYDNESAPDMPTGPAPLSLADQMNQKVLEDRSAAGVQTQ